MAPKGATKKSVMRESITSILERTQQRLDSASADLVADLKDVVNGNYGLFKGEDPKKVHLIEILFSVDGYRLNVYPVDKEYTQLGHKVLLEKYPDGVLPQYKYEPDDSEYDFKKPVDKKEFSDFFMKQEELFFNWFLKCWDQVDGKKINKPVFLMTDDNEQAYDLNKKKWVDDIEKWSN